jgi:hypothetical protein
MEAPASNAPVALPAGVTVGAGRATSATNAQGQVVQGMEFPLTTRKGSTTSVFVPYSELHDTPKVQETIAARIRAIEAIGG